MSDNIDNFDAEHFNNDDSNTDIPITKPKIGDKDFFGHPIGLAICFFAELWERFSFYGMKALMIFYLTKYHLFSDDVGYGFKGSYAALVYALPLLGGAIADRYLGFRKAVTFGAVLLTLGHLGMAYEGSPAFKTASGEIVRDETALQIFFFSLGLIIMGVGFLKPNISSIVGRLYDNNDPRKDPGYTIFYMGINTGSFLAIIVCGYLGEKFGWSYGFGAAGIGMSLGLLVFYFGAKYLNGVAEPPHPKELKSKVWGLISQEKLVYLGGILLVFVFWKVVQFEVVVGWLLGISTISVVLYLVYLLVTKFEKVQREQMFVLIFLILSSIFFWALFEQSYNSMNLFADRVIDRMVGSFEIQASQFLSLNAVFIMMLAPVFAYMWQALNRKGLEPSTPIKFGLSMIFVGLGFGALVLGIQFMDDQMKVSIIWIVLAYLLHTMGELMISPVGLSAISKLSVKNLVGLMMGTWFLATAGAEFVAAQLSKIASVKTEGGEVTNMAEAIGTYNDLFSFLLYTGITAGVVVLAISPLIKKGMHGIK